MEFDARDEQEGEEEIGPRSSHESPDSSRGTNSAGGRSRSKYRECLKNHALGLGVHAVDGCGEFMPAGDDGTLDALKCAACNCHRNFHRKEPSEDSPLNLGLHHHHHQQLSPYYHRGGGYIQVAPPQRPLVLPSGSGGGGGGSRSREEEDDVSNPGSGSRKRFRTKFTQEQKERMLGLAERLGWRIQKQDEEAVQHFCDETGVKRHVLKVWMHNNKHTLGKKP